MEKKRFKRYDSTQIKDLGPFLSALEFLERESRNFQLYEVSLILKEAIKKIGRPLFKKKPNLLPVHYINFNNTISLLNQIYILDEKEKKELLDVLYKVKNKVTIKSIVQ